MITIDDFIKTVEPAHQAFVAEAHGALTAGGFKLKIEDKATGLFASYSHPKTKRSALNFFFRKKGLFARLYPDKISDYDGLLNSLTEAMIKELDKAAPCKRLINPDDCNPKCITGYDFTIGGKRFIKCRYMCFQFLVTEESKSILAGWIRSAWRL